MSTATNVPPSENWAFSANPDDESLNPERPRQERSIAKNLESAIRRLTTPNSEDDSAFVFARVFVLGTLV